MFRFLFVWTFERDDNMMTMISFSRGADVLRVRMKQKRIAINFEND